MTAAVFSFTLHPHGDKTMNEPQLIMPTSFKQFTNDVDWVVSPKNPTTGKQVKHPAYQDWASMKARTIVGGREQRKNQTYVGTMVHINWLSFATFYAWWKSQDNQFGWGGLFMAADRQTDKDYLAPATTGKVYAPDRCLLVPHWANTLFTDSGKVRGDWPQGVSWHKRDKKYEAYCHVDGKRKHVGYFTCPIEASRAYLNFKRDNIERCIREKPMPDWFGPLLRRNISQLDEQEQSHWHEYR
jgi:hypothetical protein